MARFAKNPLVFEIPQAEMPMGQLGETDMPHAIQLKPQLHANFDAKTEHSGSSEPQHQGEPDALPEQLADDGNARPHFQPSIPAHGDAAHEFSEQEQYDPKSQTKLAGEDTYEDATKLFVQVVDRKLHDEEKDELVMSKADTPVLKEEDIAPAKQGEVTDTKPLPDKISESTKFTPTTGEEYLGMPVVIVPDIPPEPEEDDDLPGFMDCFL